MEIAPERNRTRFRKHWLQALMEMELITMTLPDTPRSKHQKYQTTSAGLELLLCWRDSVSPAENSYRLNPP